MARRRNTPLSLYRHWRFLVIGFAFAFPLFSQQSVIQSSFLPAIIRTPVPGGMLPDISETEHLSYLTLVTRENQGATRLPSDHV